MTVSGRIADGFQPVGDAFVENFTRRDEVGAALCISVDGHRVIDLWGGWADPHRGRRWEADTLVNAFSVGKGLIAACVASIGLDPDRRVVSWWPGFARHGKDGITLRHLLGHQAGLPSVRHRLPPGTQLSWSAMTDALADQEPWWEPGSGHGYHVNTFGFLVGEIVRREAGATLGETLLGCLAGPLDADVHIGLPVAEHRRVARMLWPDQGDPVDVGSSDLTDGQLMVFNAYWNPPGLSGAGVLNTAAWRSAEVPSANCHASARGVERVYAALAAGGAVDGTRVVEEEILARAAAEVTAGDDIVLGRPSRFGLGFQLTQPERPLGPNPGAFGHFGAGGSLGFCDPEAGVAFAYVMNNMGPRWQNPRNAVLLDALYACL